MRLVIFVSRGIIEEIVQEKGDEVEIIVLDDDTEGREDYEVMRIGKREYCVSAPEAVDDTKLINRVFKKVEG